MNELQSAINNIKTALRVRSDSPEIKSGFFAKELTVNLTQEPTAMRRLLRHLLGVAGSMAKERLNLPESPVHIDKKSTITITKKNAQEVANQMESIARIIHNTPGMATQYERAAAIIQYVERKRCGQGQIILKIDEARAPEFSLLILHPTTAFNAHYDDVVGQVKSDAALKVYEPAKGIPMSDNEAVSLLERAMGIKPPQKVETNWQGREGSRCKTGRGLPNL